MPFTRDRLAPSNAWIALPQKEKRPAARADKKGLHTAALGDVHLAPERTGGHSKHEHVHEHEKHKTVGQGYAGEAAIPSGWHKAGYKDPHAETVLKEARQKREWQEEEEGAGYGLIVGVGAQQQPAHIAPGMQLTLNRVWSQSGRWWR